MHDTRIHSWEDYSGQRWMATMNGIFMSKQDREGHRWLDDEPDLVDVHASVGPELVAVADALSGLLPPLLDCLRNAADLDCLAICELLATTGIVRRETYDPETHGRTPGLEDSAPGDEIWVLTELGKRFAGHEITTPEEPR